MPVRAENACPFRPAGTAVAGMRLCVDSRVDDLATRGYTRPTAEDRTRALDLLLVDQ